MAGMTYSHIYEYPTAPLGGRQLEDRNKATTLEESGVAERIDAAVREVQWANAAWREGRLVSAITTLADALTSTCHEANKTWWTDPKTGADIRDNPLFFSNKLALIHSEVSEALEGDRKGLMDDKLPQYPMREVELIDVLIRTFDLLGAINAPVGEIMAAKLAYNAQRADHKPENRVQNEGKAY